MLSCPSLSSLFLLNNKHIPSSFALAFNEFHCIDFESFLQFGKIILNSDPVLQNAWVPSSLYHMQILQAYNSVLQVSNEIVEQNWTKDWPLQGPIW